MIRNRVRRGLGKFCLKCCFQSCSDVSFPLWVNISAVIMDIIAGGVSIASVASDHWIYYGGNKTEGLFTGYEGQIKFDVERSTWLDAVSGLWITGLVIGWFTVTLIQCGPACKVPYVTYIVGWILFFISAVLRLVAVSIYTANINHGYSGSGNLWHSETVVWGYSLILAWVNTALNIPCIVLYALLVNYFKKSDVYYENDGT